MDTVIRIVVFVLVEGADGARNRRRVEDAEREDE
jgi:hypothetical protein